jgi:hypothetical protein
MIVKYKTLSPLAQAEGKCMSIDNCQVCDRYKALAGELAWALKRIAYTQQDISTPPIMSEAESMRRQATAALAKYEQEKLR